LAPECGLPAAIGLDIGLWAVTAAGSIQQNALRVSSRRRGRAHRGQDRSFVVRSRISFLTRLIFLKIAALFTFVALSLYTPSTTNSLLDGAGRVSILLARGTDGGLQYLGSQLGDVSVLVPRRGAVELAFRFVAMDKVMLFIGITIVLYVFWLLLIGLTLGAFRRPDRLKSVDTGGKPPAR
jgi:hypothetical protein